MWASPLFSTEQIKFSIKNFFSKCEPTRGFPADLLIFIKEILMETLCFL